MKGKAYPNEQNPDFRLSKGLIPPNHPTQYHLEDWHETNRAVGSTMKRKVNG